MVIRTLRATYCCSNCSNERYINYMITPRALGMVGYAVCQAKECDHCKGPMVVSGIECKTMPDIFGHAWGFWECSNEHHSTRYYVLPLRNAVERHKAHKEPRTFECWTPYETIAKHNYPWKCPRCSTAMRYRDGRKENAQKQQLIGFV